MVYEFTISHSNIGCARLGSQNPARTEFLLFQEFYQTSEFCGGTDQYIYVVYKMDIEIKMHLQISNLFISIYAH